MINLFKIKDLCEKKNIKLRQLAEMIGITPEGMSNIIKTNSTKIDTLEKIANILEVPITYFFDIEYKPKENDKSNILEDKIELYQKQIRYLEDHIETLKKHNTELQTHIIKEKPRTDSG